MKLLMIDRFPANFRAGLDQLGVDSTYLPNTHRAEVLEIIADYEILVMNSKLQIDAELIDRAERLKLVVRAGVGMDHIDEEYLAKKGIEVRNTAGANADAVGEQCLAMLLAMRTNLVRANAQVKRFEWKREENRGLELTKATVGIIGYGHTGSAVAKRLSGFGCRILAYDKYKSGFGDEQVEEVGLLDIFEQADVLSLHIPLTDETRKWIDADFLSRFHQPIYFLNLSRGPIVCISSLLRMLDEKKVLAAALDVLPNEKLHTLSEDERALYEDLFGRENVLLTPHIGGWTVESLANINGRILDYVRELM